MNQQEQTITEINQALYQLSTKLHQKTLSRAQYLNNLKEILDYAQAEVKAQKDHLTTITLLSATNSHLAPVSGWAKVRSTLKRIVKVKTPSE